MLSHVRVKFLLCFLVRATDMEVHTLPVLLCKNLCPFGLYKYFVHNHQKKFKWALKKMQVVDTVTKKKKETLCVSAQGLTRNITSYMPLF